MEITQEEYYKAHKTIRDYDLQKREDIERELQKPCPSCGGETDDSGDCHKCEIWFFNGVHCINHCTKYHTHSNSCLTPFSSAGKKV